MKGKDSHGIHTMSQKSFEAAIADLERADGPPETVLEAAAKTLRLNLEETIERSSLEVRFRSTPQSYGFKEQWLLRWLLKKLGSASTTQAKNDGQDIERYAVSPQFWSLLLDLTTSIPSSVCLEILLERKFFPILVQLIQAFRNARQLPSTVEPRITAPADETPRPRKKRRLSPPEVTAPSAGSQHEKLLWVLLQAVCRCLDLFSPRSSQNNRQSSQPLLASNLSWDEQASIMGAVLETAVNLLDHAAGPRNQGVLSEVLTVVLCFWHGDSLANQAQKEGPDRAFSSYCLMPSLAILEHLRRLDSADRSMATQQKALERLVALHVIFPTRSSFNKQFARKWADIRDVPPYPQLEATLNDLQKRMFPDERPNKPPVVASKVPKWIILDIAARLVPSSDFRRRQAEQPWIDALFIYLAHTIWPQMSQASTDVRKPFKGSQESQQTWAASLEKLLDVILAEKLRVGLPLLGYLLKAVLALEDETIPWRLLVRILQVDIGILVPTSSLSTSEEFVRQLIEKLRVPLVPKSTYDNIRDDIILPLLRGFAQSRNLPSFLTLWQQNLAVAVRTPHLPQGGTEDVTLKLVWEDQAVFDQFKAIAQTNAPPSLGQKLLGDLIEPLTELAEATGSRAGVFAQLAIFSALLETTDTPIETWKLDSGQLMAVLDTIAIALPQVSESHGRRWRLWKVARQLVCCLGVDKISQIPKTMLDSQTRFMSLTDLATLPGHPNPSKILECLECFSFLLELVAQSADFEQHFGREMESLANLLQLCCANTGAELNVCVGPHFQCDSPKSLLAACIGSLLEKHKVFSKYPDSSKRLVEMALHIMAAPGREAGDDGDIPNIKALLRAVLTAEEVMNTSLLRQCIVHYILDNSKPGVATKIDQAILRHYLSKGVIQRSQLKSLANTTMERVFDVKASKALDDVVEDLALLNLLDVNATGSVIKSEDWLTWVNFSKDITDYKQFGQSPASLSAVEMLEHILKRVWERAVTASRNQVLSDIISWCGTCIEGSLNTKQSPPFLIAVPIFLEKAALLSRATPSTTISKKDLQKMTTSYTSTISRRLESSLCGKTDFSTLLNLRLLLNSARQTQASEVDEALSKNAFEFAQRLHAEQLSLEHSKATAAVHFLRASVEKRCWELSTPLNRMPSDVMRQVLASITRDVATHTNEQLNLLSIEADTLANHMAPTEWADVLGRLRQHSKEGSAGEFRQLFISSVILRIKDHHLQHDPRLTDELANIASLNTSGQYTPTELFLALENCRMVLQSHPLTVNQATLDRLLACLCLVDVSPHHYESSYPQNSQEQYGPQPADIYEELCMFLGVILGRHRRRISDRYHLLLPVMQRLLRCLFWPGTHALQDRQRSAAANDLNAYGRSLPQWIRGAEQPLPPSSAEKFSRLASSICNPTVSAARSSRKHGHNQLNDETKRARLLAGQHMQYLVMEYARCTLDGQITPTVKDKLMPGMYSVLDSMGRDLLRAANAGMDPSSRAIFKGLYDDFTRFGRWDKS
ncbi:Urb2/Npa2 family-domain-containing protein [Exophiala viscosa]|uniref:Urb2/Npa2 family-domain-containing protein n=1 Tax=Exophiala viscosa TaxID=2486360 RepID=A0AAN6DUY7_9EURO|nr:Urb2/Npa2 family-domain-containing protein [Exophiala viscosa]KAI1626227.1 Urb2/Npa2 family-domain-containing protein [Exophiala viscosa]